MSEPLWLPWPPTSNTMFGLRGHHRFVSKKYQEWKDLAAAHIAAQKPTTWVCSVDIHIALTAPTKRKWDIDNRIKPILDVLVTHQIITDDNTNVVRSITAVAANDDRPGATIRVLPKEMVGNHQAAGAAREGDTDQSPSQYLPNGTEG
jgi:Holliday junction resolvase RusA-like endonuclease